MKSEPRFILSKKAVLKQYRLIKELCFNVSYSFKTNHEVGYILRDNTDCMFSVHSLASVNLLGCPRRIWFFLQGIDLQEAKELLSIGIRNFVADNETDLNVLLDFLKNNKGYSKVSLLLRMKLKENTIHTGKHFVFGMPSRKVKTLIGRLKAEGLFEKLGIHFHRKTQNISEWSLKDELEQSLDEECLNAIDILNMGGGIPAEYKNFRGGITNNVFQKIKELKNWLIPYGIDLIAEPGRFIAAPAVNLETEIVNIYDNNIIVNASIYSGAMDTFVSHIRLAVHGELADGEGKAYTIKGKTPDSIDIFRYRVFLDNPKPGDKIVFLNAGAYTYSTDFCGLKKPKTIIAD